MARMLFSFIGGTGHLNPLLPIAQAAVAAGHAVAVAGAARLAPRIEAAGLRANPLGPVTPPQVPQPVVAPDAAHEQAVVRRYFAGGAAAQRVDELRPVIAGFAPDVLVCDEMDFGAMVAAERAAVPHASVVVIAAGGFVRPAAVVTPLNALRATHGLPPDLALAMLSRYLVLAPLPPGYRDPIDPLPATAHLIRPGGGRQPALDPALDRWLQADARPVVYFTLGTVFNLESGDLMADVLAGLRALPARVLMTVGEERDPAACGPQPGHVRIERYVPQEPVLARCRLAVTHAGSGSVVGALAAGVPLVLLPMGADQLGNAARCAALGVARVLDVMTAASTAVTAAARAAWADDVGRARAAAFQAATAALPGPEHAVTLLARLAATRAPVLPV